MTDLTLVTLIHKEWAFENNGIDYDVVTVDRDRYVVENISDDVIAEHIVALHNYWLREMKDIGAFL